MKSKAHAIGYVRVVRLWFIGNKCVFIHFSWKTMTVCLQTDQSICDVRQLRLCGINTWVSILIIRLNLITVANITQITTQSNWPLQ